MYGNTKLQELIVGQINSSKLARSLNQDERNTANHPTKTQEGKPMNIQHLRYFVELAHTHSYTIAAQSLHITQPSLSYAISQLEDELGVPLFIRNGRTNVLTTYGNQFLTYAEGALKTLDSGVAAIHNTAREETVIRVGFLTFLGTKYIPNLLYHFREKYPDSQIVFHCETGSTALLLEGLDTNRFDVVFCAPSRQVPRLGTMVGHQRLYLIMPENHPLAERKEVKLEDTFQYPYVYYPRGSSMRNIIERRVPNLHEKLDIQYELMEERAVSGFVAAGFGLGIVPEMALSRTLPVRRVEIVDPVLEREIYMVPTMIREQSPALNMFLDYVRKHTMEEEG